MRIVTTNFAIVGIAGIVLVAAQSKGGGVPMKKEDIPTGCNDFEVLVGTRIELFDFMNIPLTTKQLEGLARAVNLV
jgi:hypothetical protein